MHTDTPEAASGLHDMFMYQLYQAWSQANPVFVRLCEGRFGITRREWRVLACSVEGGSLTSTELAAAAQLDLVRTSRTLGVLCDKGWLLRVPHPDDRRVVRVEPTEAGRACYRDMLPEVRKLNQLLTQDLTQEEIQLMRGLLGKVARRGLIMAHENIVQEKANRREGGTRNAGSRRD